MEALGGKFVWPGARTAMALEWSNKNERPKPKRERRKKQATQPVQEASDGQGLAPALLAAPEMASFWVLRGAS
jgi:hypothetical protein